jgi:hypothetical protein
MRGARTCMLLVVVGLTPRHSSTSLYQEHVKEMLRRAEDTMQDRYVPPQAEAEEVIRAASIWKRLGRRRRSGNDPKTSTPRGGLAPPSNGLMSEEATQVAQEGFSEMPALPQRKVDWVPPGCGPKSSGAALPRAHQAPPPTHAVELGSGVGRGDEEVYATAKAVLSDAALPRPVDATYEVGLVSSDCPASRSFHALPLRYGNRQYFAAAEFFGDRGCAHCHNTGWEISLAPSTR